MVVLIYLICEGIEVNGRLSVLVTERECERARVREKRERRRVQLGV